MQLTSILSFSHKVFEVFILRVVKSQDLGIKSQLSCEVIFIVTLLQREKMHRAKVFSFFAQSFSTSTETNYILAT